MREQRSEGKGARVRGQRSESARVNLRSESARVKERECDVLKEKEQ